MGSQCLFTRQRVLTMGYFYWQRDKTSNHLHTELSLGYPKDTKFYLESKASFIDISSISSFKLFFDCLVAGILHFFGQFRGQLEVLAMVKIHPVGDFFPKNSCSTIKLFFFFKYVLCQTVLSKYLRKHRGPLCSFKRKGEFISLSSLVSLSV